jgi:hypothetical protein
MLHCQLESSFLVVKSEFESGVKGVAPTLLPRHSTEIAVVNKELDEFVLVNWLTYYLSVCTYMCVCMYVSSQKRFVTANQTSPRVFSPDSLMSRD